MRHKLSPAAVQRAFVAGSVALGQVSVKVLRFFPRHCRSTVAPYSYFIYLPPALCHSYNWQFYRGNTVLGESGILVVYVLPTVKGWARSRRTPVPMKAKCLDGPRDSGEDTSVLERSQRTRRVVTKARTSGHFNDKRLLCPHAITWNI
jgi:hypothetical protein